MSIIPKRTAPSVGLRAQLDQLVPPASTPTVAKEAKEAKKAPDLRKRSGLISHLREESPADYLRACSARATERVMVYSGLSRCILEGVTYTCRQHAAETVEAVEATGAAAEHVRGALFFDPDHVCGEVRSFVGATR